MQNVGSSYMDFSLNGEWMGAIALVTYLRCAVVKKR